MNEQPTEVRLRLVKWEGDPEEGADPVGHPRVIEVLEAKDGETPHVIYRRESNG
jgi:hypothetical protein